MFQRLMTSYLNDASKKLITYVFRYSRSLIMSKIKILFLNRAICDQGLRDSFYLPVADADRGAEHVIVFIRECCSEHEI